MTRGTNLRPGSLLLLLALLLLVQTAALLHGYQHGLHEHDGDHDAPVCEQCLAFATLGAALTATRPHWSPPTVGFVYAAPVPAMSPRGFRPTYQSRAPPSFPV